MREIILDTETTGLDPKSGHRIVEIGCVELVNFIPTGRVYHQYINPGRDMPAEAFAVHGLSADFLSKYPTFSMIVNDFLEFISDDSKVVIHNASFDMKFLDWEFTQTGHSLIDRSRVIDTLLISRKENPGGRHNLDALCKKFGVNNASRQYHGALLDSQLLAEVYLHLMGGRQPTFSLKKEDSSTSSLLNNENEPINFEYRSFPVNTDELQAHREFLKQIKNVKWLENA